MPLVSRSAEHGLASSLPTIETSLDDQDPQLRRRAVRALSGDPANAVALTDRLAREPDPSVRSAIFTALAGMEHPTTIAAMRPLLASADADLRNGAISAMRQMPDTVGLAMPDILSDQDPDIRLFGVNIIQGLAHPAASEWLIHLIAHEPEANIAGAAIEALAELAGPEVIVVVDAAARRFADVPYLQFTCDFVRDRLRGLA